MQFVLNIFDIILLKRNTRNAQEIIKGAAPRPGGSQYFVTPVPGPNAFFWPPWALHS